MVVATRPEKNITSHDTAPCKVYIAWVDGNPNRTHYDQFSTVKVMLRGEERPVSDFKVVPVISGRDVNDVIYGSDASGKIYALGLPAAKTQVSGETVYHTKPFGFGGDHEYWSCLRHEMQKTVKQDDVVVCSSDMIFFEQCKKQDVKQLNFILAY